MRLLLILLSLLLVVVPVQAQDPPQPIQDDQHDLRRLAEMQEALRSSYRMLLQRMRATAASPDAHQRELLEKAVALMDKLMIQQDMEQLEEAINDRRLSSAVAKAQRISEKITQVLAVLDGRPEDWERDARIPSLQEQIEQLNHLRDRQRELETESRKLHEKSELTDQDLDYLERLKEEQRQLAEEAAELADIVPEEVKPLIDEALKSMDDAFQQLQQENPKEAEQSQKDAGDKLDEARQKMEDDLREYRDRENEQLLIHVEAELAKIRAAQFEVNQKTIAAETGEPLSRRDWRTLRLDQDRLRKESEALAEKLIYGNVPIFGSILKGVARDMKKSATLLRSRDTGEYTQDLQNEILLRIDDLLEALRMERQRRQNEGGGPPQQTDPNGEQAEPRLVPLPAELGILLKRQEYLRHKHERFLERYPEIKDRSQMSDAQRRIYERLSQEQGENAGYLEALMDSLFPQQGH